MKTNLESIPLGTLRYGSAQAYIFCTLPESYYIVYNQGKFATLDKFLLHVTSENPCCHKLMINGVLYSSIFKRDMKKPYDLGLLLLRAGMLTTKQNHDCNAEKERLLKNF